MNREMEPFDRPNRFERMFNKLFGLLIGLGLGLPHNYLLQVRGRRSGRLYSTPVDVLKRNGQQFLVAGRGYTQWVRNAVASGSVSLKKGRQCKEFALRAVPDEEKPDGRFGRRVVPAVCCALSGLRADAEAMMGLTVRRALDRAVQHPIGAAGVMTTASKPSRAAAAAQPAR